jgi:hypothetical protein
VISIEPAQVLALQPLNIGVPAIRRHRRTATLPLDEINIDRGVQTRIVDRETRASDSATAYSIRPGVLVTRHPQPCGGKPDAVGTA